VLVLRVLGKEVMRVGVDLDQLEVLDLILEVFHKLAQFRFDIAFPHNKVLIFFTHHTQLNKIAIGVKKVNRLEQVLPILLLLIDILNQLRPQSQILPSYMTRNPRHIMCRVHMRL
jgi:hypothetical protein